VTATVTDTDGRRSVASSDALGQRPVWYFWQQLAVMERGSAALRRSNPFQEERKESGFHYVSRGLAQRGVGHPINASDFPSNPQIPPNSEIQSASFPQTNSDFGSSRLALRLNLNMAPASRNFTIAQSCFTQSGQWAGQGPLAFRHNLCVPSPPNTSPSLLGSAPWPIWSCAK